MLQVTVRPPATLPWLLAGPGSETEFLSSHLERLGPRPLVGPALIADLKESQLRGRGGARFPAATKWEAVRSRSRGKAVVLANGAEGEPASFKDRLLMTLRPHLVLDGAEEAAAAVGAERIVFYVNRSFEDARVALQQALQERRRARLQTRPVDLVSPPPRYVAGEETAAVNFVNGGRSKPSATPPRPFERGVGRLPTLVQNVETLAWAGLIARFGPQWFKSLGTGASPGALLLSVSGALAAPGLYEVPHGTRLADVVAQAGGPTVTPQAVLLGGFFGTWVPWREASELPLDDAALAPLGIRLGCGVVHLLGVDACGLNETSRIFSFLASESARQCGPCAYGLTDLAAVVERIAAGRAGAQQWRLLDRWARQLGSGRGACKHPDGAVGMLESGLKTFSEELQRHRRGSCPAHLRVGRLPVPTSQGGREWR